VYNFLAEISKKIDKEILPTPYNYYDKTSNLYYIDMAEHPKSTYWRNWGGWYDYFVGTQLSIYYDGRFLLPVNSLEDVARTNYSIYIKDKEVQLIDGGSVSGTNINIIDNGNAFTVYFENVFDGDEAYINTNKLAIFNIPNHPWLVPYEKLEYNELLPFLTTTLNPNNPSNNILRKVNSKIRFDAPNFNIKLSDNIAGITLNQEFSVIMYNDDGYFDDEIDWNLFNTPIYIRKSIVPNPKYYNFKLINTGIISNLSISFDRIQINASDKLRAMNMPVCELITNGNEKLQYIDISDKSYGKNIPIIYGKKNIKLQELNELEDDRALFVGVEYINQISNIKDKDENIISNSDVYIENNIIISAPSIVETADINGYLNNKIGEIIIDLIFKKAEIPFNSTFWNIEEVNRYISSCARINTIISGGDVRKTIQDILKNDLAYFIQQSDGRFTIRKYGWHYKTHHIKPEMITKRPEKNWDNSHNNFFTSCIINYIDDNLINQLFLYNENERELENKYRKTVQKTFDTELRTVTDAKNLAVLLSKRFSAMPQTLKVSVGVDTSQFELLDTVELNAEINNRKFNNTSTYFIKEINPAQDVLVLEQIKY